MSDSLFRVLRIVRRVCRTPTEPQPVAGRSSIHRYRYGLPLMLLLALPGTSCLADELDLVEAAPPSIAITPIDSTSSFGPSVDASDLDIARGGADTGASNPSSAVFANGSVNDNRAVDVITGSNTIRDGSFANVSGLPIVIQNTGANVLIQSATIVNVQLR